MQTGERAIWQPFVRAAIAISLVAGFGAGTLLFASLLFDIGDGLWWPAVAQAHGHAQLFGWAGLMVLGIALHFFPRLASAPAVPAGLARAAFWMLLSGLLLRIVSRSVMSVSDPSMVGRAADFAWIVGVSSELAGTLLVVAGLGRSMVGRRALPGNLAVRLLLPLFAVSFLSLLAVLSAALLLGLSRLPGGELPISHTTSDDLNTLMLYGFLTPISVAMSARLFPLYVRTGTPLLRLLLIGLLLLIVGCGLRVLGVWAGGDSVETAGRLLIPAAIGCFVIGTRVLGPRRALPRRPMRLWQDATGLHALSAYIWLVGAAVVQSPGLCWLDAEMHLLGMGFITMLIFGMGVHLIPGFGRETMCSPRYLWATLILGNIATVCRVILAIPDLRLDSALEHTIGASAGTFGLSALVLFAINVSSVLLQSTRKLQGR